MSAVAFSAASAATRVAANGRNAGAKNAGKSSRAVSMKAAAASSSKQASSFFNGDRSASLSLRRQVSQVSQQRASTKRVVSASAATPAPVVKAAAPAEWKGAKLKPLGELLTIQPPATQLIRLTTLFAKNNTLRFGQSRERSECSLVFERH